jgi:hypothetical protein
MNVAIFEKLELEETALILDRLNPKFEGITFDPIETVIRALHLPFYPGLRLLDIVCPTTIPVIQRYVVYGKTECVMIDYTNKPIYELNDRYPVRIEADSVEDYGRFFLNLVRGNLGRFILVENVDDVPWKEEPPPPARKAIAKMISPLSIINASPKGFFDLSACLVFKNGLFRAKLTIDQQGQVKIHEEMLLIEDMPILDEIFE